MSDAEKIKRGVIWLSVATVILYISIVGGGIYLYVSGSNAKETKRNTQRLIDTVGAFCEIVAAIDKEEPGYIHDLALQRLKLKSGDCKVIVENLKKEEVNP